MKKMLFIGGKQAFTELTEAEMEAAKAGRYIAAPSEIREQAYNTDQTIPWSGAMLTVTEAAQQWSYYAAEGDSGKADELTALIAAAKADIRAKYPDNAGGT